MKLATKAYLCSECSQIKMIETNHFGECYGQPLLRMNMYPNCSWKHPMVPIVWKCLDRACARCGDVLNQNDDLICGFHHLEGD